MQFRNGILQEDPCSTPTSALLGRLSCGVPGLPAQTVITATQQHMESLKQAVLFAGNQSPRHHKAGLPLKEGNWESNHDILCNATKRYSNHGLHYQRGTEDSFLRLGQYLSRSNPFSSGYHFAHITSHTRHHRLFSCHYLPSFRDRTEYVAATLWRCEQ